MLVNDLFLCFNKNGNIRESKAQLIRRSDTLTLTNKRVIIDKVYMLKRLLWIGLQILL